MDLRPLLCVACFMWAPPLEAAPAAASFSSASGDSCPAPALAKDQILLQHRRTLGTAAPSTAQAGAATQATVAAATEIAAAAVTPTATATIAADFYPVDGGDDRMCRGALDDPKLLHHYKLYGGDSLSDIRECQKICYQQWGCSGITHVREKRQCYVWHRQTITRSISWPGAVCQKFMPATTMTTTTLPSHPEFLPVDKGMSRACRGANKDDNADSHYKIRRAGSLMDCEALCMKDPECTGVEWDDQWTRSPRRCELWTFPGGPGASVYKPGYHCMRYDRGPTTSGEATMPASTTATTTAEITTTAPATTTTQALAADFYPVDGGDDRMCRGALDDPKLLHHYKLYSGGSLSDIRECQKICYQQWGCGGITHVREKRQCYVWHRQTITRSISWPGAVCQKFMPATTMTTTTLPSHPEFLPVDKGMSRACRGANKDDNADSHYKIRRTGSLMDCEALCMKDPECTGVEWDDQWTRSPRRCELWTFPGGPGASVYKPGYHCMRYDRGSAAAVQAE